MEREEEGRSGCQENRDRREYERNLEEEEKKEGRKTAGAGLQMGSGDNYGRHGRGKEGGIREIGEGGDVRAGG